MNWPGMIALSRQVVNSIGVNLDRLQAVNPAAQNRFWLTFEAMQDFLDVRWP